MMNQMVFDFEETLEINCPEVEVTGTYYNAMDAKLALDKIRPDLAFLDIQMPGKSGMEMLAEMDDRKFEVIFVTAHNEFLLQALQFSAADYLTKPVDEDRLVEAVERVKQRIRPDRDDGQADALIHNIHKAGFPLEMRLCLPTLKGFTIVKLEEIVIVRRSGVIPFSLV
jgi:two-component system LytT family response regulator